MKFATHLAAELGKVSKACRVMGLQLPAVLCNYQTYGTKWWASGF
jgi:hypothetical protein